MSIASGSASKTMSSKKKAGPIGTAVIERFIATKPTKRPRIKPNRPRRKPYRGQGRI
jgi:hypothetical protein